MEFRSGHNFGSRIDSTGPIAGTRVNCGQPHLTRTGSLTKPNSKDDSRRLPSGKVESGKLPHLLGDFGRREQVARTQFHQ